MKEFLVLHAVWTLLFAVMATVNFDKLVIAIAALPLRKGKAARTDLVVNIVATISVILVSLVPLPLIAIAVVKKIAIAKKK